MKHVFESEDQASSHRWRRRALASVIQVPIASGQQAMPAVPLEAVMSFLKQTRGLLTWTVRDMSDALKISQDESRHIGAILALQGYVKQCAEDGVWMTTINGEAVSDSKPPHFSLARVHKALADLQNRISSNNVDRKAEFRVVQAVAFGDFLLERPVAQAADVGISVVSSKDRKTSVEADGVFLNRLRARNPVLHLEPYRPWMSARWHRRLL